MTRRSRKTSFLIVACSFAAFFPVWLLLASNLKASQIECYTQFGTCPEKYFQELGGFVQVSLLKPLPHDKVKKTLEKFPEVKSIALHRRLPRTLIVSVQSRKPLGTVGSQVLGAKYIVDEDGVVIESVTKSNLPLLVATQSFKSGDKLSELETSALQVLAQVSQLNLGAIHGQTVNDQLSIYLANNTKIILDLKHLSKDWYPTLQVILARSKILAKMPSIIDLRFSSPTLTF